MQRKQRHLVFISGIFVLTIWAAAFGLILSQPGASTNPPVLPTLINLASAEETTQPFPTPLPAQAVNEAALNLPAAQDDDGSLSALSDAMPSAAPQNLLIPDIPGEPVPNTVVIRFKAGTSLGQQNAYLAEIGGQIVQRIEALDTVVLAVPDEVSTGPLPPSSLVAQSEPDYFVAGLDTLANDPFFGGQWNLAAIGAPTVWASLPSDLPAAIVAVLDSGICADHPDLQHRITADGWDFVDDDAIPQDEYGHGCGVAGVVAAQINNGIGVAGVAPNARIMPLRVLDSQGIGTYSRVAAAIVYAVDHGAQIINLSLGGVNTSGVLQDAVDYALIHNVLVIAAAGNTGQQGALFPASYAPVIAVGAVDQTLERSSFSNYGPQIDLYAPGRDIMTTTLDGYRAMSGTSLAAPHVAGVAAVELALGRGLQLTGGLVAFAPDMEDVDSLPTDDGLLVCDQTEVEAAYAAFEAAVIAHTESPLTVTEADIRTASAAYQAAAEQCAQLMYNDGTLSIDSGGQHLRGADAVAQFQPFGTKWGDSSPFTNPPATGGGVVTYSFMPGGIDLSPEEGIELDDNGRAFSVGITQLPGHVFDPANPNAPGTCNLLDEIRAAFDAWSAIANIEFQEVGDNVQPFNSPGANQGMLRIGAHKIDLLGRELGHAYFPPPVPGEEDATGTGDIHFDAADLWGCETVRDPVTNQILVLDIGIVAMHEIGHAIGMGHEPNTLAVMNPRYNEALSVLQDDDKNGAKAIYGARGSTTVPLSPITSGSASIPDTLPEFTWSPLAGVTTYQLQVSSVPDFSTLIIDKTTELQPFKSPVRLANGIYYWRIRGYNPVETSTQQIGWLPWSSPAVSFQVSIGIPRLLHPVNGSASSDGTPAFEWSAVPGDNSRYQLQIARGSQFLSADILVDVNVNTRAYTVPEDQALGDGPHFWRVRVRDASSSAPWSLPWQFTVDSHVPTSSDPLIAGNLVTFQWDPVPGAVEYQLQIDTSPNFVGLLFLDKLFLDKLFLDKLFLDKLFLDKLFLDKLFLDKLFLDKLFLDKLFLDKLFLDKLFLDKLFLDKLFLDKLFLDKLVTNSATAPRPLSEGLHYWRVRARLENGTWTGWSDPKTIRIDTKLVNIVINEIKVDDPSWIELYNAGTQTVDLTGWQFVSYTPNGSIGLVYTFPNGFSMDPGEYVILYEAAGVDTDSALYLGADTINWPLNAPGAISGQSIIHPGDEAISSTLPPTATLVPNGASGLSSDPHDNPNVPVHEADKPQESDSGLPTVWAHPALDSADRALAQSEPELIAQATITVNTTSMAVTADAQCSLPEAIIAANTNSAFNGCPAGSSGQDTIELGAGLTYGVAAVNNTNDGPNGLPQITSDIVINGNGSTITRTSEVSLRFFHVAAGSSLTLSDLTISAGASGGNNGGAVYVRGSLTVNNILFEENQDTYGGAIYGNGSGAVITANNSRFVNNNATTSGGAIASDNSSELYITDSLFEVNTAFGGGAVHVTGPAEINRTLFDSNSVNFAGGAIFTQGDITILNSTFYNNSASFSGGAILSEFGTMHISFSTFHQNEDVFGGASIYNDNGGTVVVRNSILANSGSGSECSNNGGGSLSASGVNYDTDGTCAAIDSGFTEVTSGQLNLQPLAANGGPTDTLALGAGSIAIEAAPDCLDLNTANVTVDQRGFGRPSGANCDVGAFEVGGAIITVNSTVMAVAVDGVCSLLEAIQAANDDASVNECPAGTGADVIELGTGESYSLMLVNNNTDGTNGLPSVTGPLTINGNGSTIARTGIPAFRIFHVGSAGNLTLNEMTISNGTAANGGGGVYVNGGVLSVNNSTLSNNSGLGGGGIYNAGGTVSVANTTLSGNSSGFGDGGAIYNSSAASLNVTRSTLSDNTAFNGGGIYNDGELTLLNSTLSANSANDFGGNLHSGDGTANVAFATIVKGSGVGSNIYTIGGTINIKNSIVSDHQGTFNCDGSAPTAFGVNFASDPSCGFGFTNTATPLIDTTLADNGGPTLTHALANSSPAENAALDCTDLAGNPVQEDQRGTARPQAMSCDTGAFEAGDSPQAGPIFTVNTADDTNDLVCSAAHCSLREAINAANADVSANIIHFDIPGGGPHTIQPASALPTITGPVTIDGTTQPGASCDVWPPTLLVELDGSGVGGGANGLTISAGNSTIRGLVINRFSGHGIELNTSGNNVIECSFIGMPPAGNSALPNGVGVAIFGSSSSNRIGGTSVNNRNLISGNALAGIHISASSSNIIENNYIGTNTAGTASYPNGGGIDFYGGIVVTDSTGTQILRNLISGNTGDGIGLWDNTTGTIIQGNLIGTQGDALSPLGNTGGMFEGMPVGGGVVIRNFASNNVIGGAGPGEGNIIAHNTPSGIAAYSGTGNRFSGNSIFSNSSIGIDLPPALAANTNDIGDADTGSNNLQNHPILTSAVDISTSTLITGTFSSAPNSTYDIEFFTSPTCDASGSGEGQTFFASSVIATDPNGDANLYIVLPVLVTGNVMTATATDSEGNTSEFSPCVTITGDTPQVAPSYTVNTTDMTNDEFCGVVHCSLIDAINAANSDGVTSTISLAPNTTYELTSVNNVDNDNNGLPVITTVMTIHGNGSTITRAAPAPGFRIFRVTGGDLTINNATISNGLSTFGGAGLYVSPGSLALHNSTVKDNSAPSGGGVLGGGSAAVFIINSTISGNQALSNDGGGVFIAGTGVINNSTISGNSAAATGGGIVTSADGSPDVKISHSTITGNSANFGAGVMHYDGTIVLKNSIVANQLSGENCNGTITSQGVNFADDDTCPGFNMSAAPLISSTLANNGGPTQTHALLPASPAIDAATDCTFIESISVSTDQRGVSRPQGAQCDAGAFEFVAANQNPTAVTDARSTTPGTPITIMVLANDSDADGDPLSAVSVTTPGKGSAVINYDPPGIPPASCAPTAPRAPLSALLPGAADIQTPVECDQWLPTNPLPVTASGNLVSAALIGKALWPLVYTAEEVNPKYYPQGTISAACTNPQGVTLMGDSWAAEVFLGREGIAQEFQIVLVAVDAGGPADLIFQQWLTAGCQSGSYPGFLITEGDRLPGEVVNQVLPAGLTELDSILVRTTNHNTITYTPNVSFTNGVDSFNYTVSDGKGGTAAATVTISMSPTAIPNIIHVTSCDASELISAINDANVMTDANVIELNGACAYTLAAVENNTNGSNGLPSITSDVTINANGAVIERSAAANFRLFHVAAGGRLTLNNATLSNGSAAQGGLIYNNGTLVINTSALLNGAASSQGGAIYNAASGQLIIVEAGITGSSAGTGGAIHNAGTASITESTLASNQATAGSGGGLYNTGALSVTSTTFDNNSSAARGGGLHSENGNVVISESLFAGNSAANFGGGLSNAGGASSFRLMNATVYGNTAGSAGGLYTDGGTTNLNFVTMTENTNGGLQNASATVNVKNSVIAAQGSGLNCVGAVTPSGVNYTTGTSCAGFTQATPAQLALQALTDNGGLTQTVGLGGGSVLIDKATDCTLVNGVTGVTVDQRGAPRPFAAACDVGAYEAGASAPVIGTLGGAAALTAPGAASGIDFVQFGNPRIPAPAGTNWTGGPVHLPNTGETLARDPASSDTDHRTDWASALPTLGGQNRIKVVVNEIFPGTVDAIELFNVSVETVRMGGWQLLVYDGSGDLVTPNPGDTATYVFPPDFTLPPATYMVIYEGSAPVGPASPEVIAVYLGFDIPWPNWNAVGAVALTNGVAGVDFMRFGDAQVGELEFEASTQAVSDVLPPVGTNWTGISPIAPLPGQSVGRDAQSTDTDDGSDWFTQPASLHLQNPYVRPAQNDSPFDAIEIQSVPFRNRQDTTAATRDLTLEPTSACGFDVGRTVWYRYTPQTTQFLRFQTDGSDYDTVLSIWTDPPIWTEVINDNDSGEGTRSRIPRRINCATEQPIVDNLFMAQAGVTYYIMVGGANNIGGNLVFSVNAPVNDDFDDAIMIGALPFSDSQQTLAASLPADDPAPSCGLNVGRSVWYVFHAITDNITRFSTAGSDYDTILALWTGERGNLVEVACNNDVENSFTSRLEFRPVPGTTYYLMAAGNRADFGRLVFEASIVLPPPNDFFADAIPITLDASGAFAPFIMQEDTYGATQELTDPAPTCGTNTGKSVWFRYEAQSSAAVVFNTTGSDFDTVMSIHTSLAPGDEAACNDDVTAGGLRLGSSSALRFEPIAGETYYILVTGHQKSGGFLRFEAYIESPPPFNDEPDAGAVLIDPLPFRHEQSTTGATVTINEAYPSCLPESGKSVWFLYQAGENKILRFETTGSSYDTVLSVLVEQGSSLDEIACNDDVAGGTHSQVTLNVTSGGVYYVRVGGAGDASGLLRFRVTEILPAPPNDDFDNVREILALPYRDQQSTFTAETAFDDPLPGCGTNIDKTIWYRYTAVSDDLLRFQTDGSDYDNALSIWTGAPGSLAEVACDDDGGPGTAAYVELYPVTGETYYIMIGGNNGAVGEARLQVDVFPAPPNDDFDNALVIPGVPGSAQPINTKGATSSIDDPLAACNLTTSRTVWYQFTPSDPGTMSFNTFGSDYDTVLAVYTGTRTNLTPLACNDNFGGGKTSNVDSIPAVPGTTYFIMVGGAFGQNGTLQLQSDQVIPPPNDELAGALPLDGLPNTLIQSTSTASSAPDDPLSCGFSASKTVWYSYTAAANELLRLNTTGSSFNPVVAVYSGAPGSLTPIACEVFGKVDAVVQAGLTYFIMIGGYNGGSGDLALSASVVSIPPNDQPQNATIISLPFSSGATLDIQGATRINEPPVSCDATAAKTVWYQYTAQPGDGLLRFDTTGSNFGTTIAVFKDTPGGLLEVACGIQQGVDVLAEPGTTYRVLFGGHAGLSGLLAVNASQVAPPSNDDFDSAKVIPGFPYSDTENTIGASTAPDDPGTCSPGAGKTVWYQYTSTGSGSLRIDTTGSGFGTVLAVYTGGRSQLKMLACSNPSALDIDVQPGQTYFIMVAGIQGSSGTLHLAITGAVSVAPPDMSVTVVLAPSSIAEPGGPVNFTVTIRNASGLGTVELTAVEDNFGNTLNATCVPALPALLNPNAFATCTAIADIGGQAGDLVEYIATATGQHSSGSLLIREGSAQIVITNVASSINVTKSATPALIKASGEHVTYTIVVENTSLADTVTLSALSDNVFGDISADCAPSVVGVALAPGDSHLCAFTRFVTPLQPGDTTHVNTVTAAGTDDDGDPVSGASSAAVTLTCDNPNPLADLRHSESHLIGPDYRTGVIYNKSAICSYVVGMASYKKFDNVVDNQLIFDYTPPVIVGPGERVTLEVELPACATQVDLFYGEVLMSLYQQRYAKRLLNAIHLGGSSFCAAVNLSEPPPAPGDLLANALADSTQVALSWSGAASDETVFVIERSANGTDWMELAAVPTSQNAYLDTAPLCYTPYTYRVRTFRLLDSMFSSDIAITNVTTNCAPLTAPSDLSAVAISASQIDLTWATNDPSADQIEIQRSPDGASWSDLATISSTHTGYADTGLTCNTAYFYRVRVVRTMDVQASAYAAPDNATTAPCAPPDAPQNLMLTALQADQAQLVWTYPPAGDPIAFDVQFSSDNATWIPAGQSAVTSFLYSDAALACEVTYYFRVRAVRMTDLLVSAYISGSVTMPACPSGLAFTTTAVKASNVVGLYNEGSWQFHNMAEGGAGQTISIAFGPKEPGWQALVGDWNGDGVNGIGLYKEGVWLLRSLDPTGGVIDIIITFGPGEPGWQAVTGDWDGDGLDTVGLYKEGTWLLRNSSADGDAGMTFSFGQNLPGAKAIAGDWDGDGLDTVGLYKDGVWYLHGALVSGDSPAGFSFGPAQGPWQPVIGDWDGDGTEGIGLFSESIWRLRNSSSEGASDLGFNFGPVGSNAAGGQPVSGHWDTFARLSDFDDSGPASLTLVEPTSTPTDQPEATTEATSESTPLPEPTDEPSTQPEITDEATPQPTTPPPTAAPSATALPAPTSSVTPAPSEMPPPSSAHPPSEATEEPVGSA